MNSHYIEHILSDIMVASEEDFGNQTLTPEEANSDLTREISSWTGVTVHSHVMGGLEFRYGDHQLGHIHNPAGDTATADLELPMKFRDELVGSGRVKPHITDKQGTTGWVTVPMGTVAEVALAIRLFEYKYDRNLK